MPAPTPKANTVPDLTDAEVAELDDLLFDIPEPYEPLAIPMVDGFLCGVLAQPVAVPEASWQALVLDWNEDGDRPPLSGDTPGWHSAKHERLCALMTRRMTALNASMVQDAWFDPLLMMAEDEAGEPLKGRALIDGTLAPWVLGFEHAMNCFPDLQDLVHEDVPDLLACLFRHLPEQTEEEQVFTKALDQEHPLTNLDAAVSDLVGNVMDLAAIGRDARLKGPTLVREGPKTGRNDPCPCGSGKKFKQCHGAA